MEWSTSEYGVIIAHACELLLHALAIHGYVDYHDFNSHYKAEVLQIVLQGAAYSHSLCLGAAQELQWLSF